MSYPFSLPTTLSDTELFKLLKMPYVCPWCGLSKIPYGTSRRDRMFAEGSWILTPVRTLRPNWVCVACAIYLYTACLSLDLEDDMDANLVKGVAAEEDVTTAEIQRRVLDHEEECIRQHDPEGRDANYDWLRLRIRELRARAR